MTDIEGRSNYSNLEFKFELRSIDITLIKYIHLPVGETTAFDCKMIKSSDLAEGPVLLKIKSQREDCLPQTLRVEYINSQIHMIVTNTGQGQLYIYMVKILW